MNNEEAVEALLSILIKAKNLRYLKLGYLPIIHEIAVTRALSGLHGLQCFVS